MDLQVFDNESFGSVRAVVVDDVPWFLGKDIAERLEYTNTPKAIRDHVCDEDKLTERIVLSGQNREAIFINESGVYSLVLSSKLPKAKEFKHWITSEVLPALRNNGKYEMPSNATKYDISGMQLKLMESMVGEMRTLHEYITEVSNRTSMAAVDAFNANKTAHEVQMSLGNMKEAIKPIPQKEWRDTIIKKIRKVCEAGQVPYGDTIREMYGILEQRAGCNLTTRVKHRRARAERNGATATEVNKINRLDCISADKKLREIFSKVVSEYEIRYCV